MSDTRKLADDAARAAAEEISIRASCTHAPSQSGPKWMGRDEMVGFFYSIIRRHTGERVRELEKANVELRGLIERDPTTSYKRIRDLEAEVERLRAERKDEDSKWWATVEEVRESRDTATRQLADAREALEGWQGDVRDFLKALDSDYFGMDEPAKESAFIGALRDRLATAPPEKEKR